MSQRLLGYGGGKGEGEAGAQRSPTESPDSLKSSTHARVVDLLCEGEIVGLVNGLKSVYLDGVPIQNGDGSYNFKDVVLYDVKGTQAQEYIPGFGDAEAETVVNTQVVHATPVVRAISDPNVDAVRVTIQIPQLSQFDTTTKYLGPTTVEISVEVQPFGGSYSTQVIAGIFQGKCTSPYERSIRVELTGAAPWNIRVSRVTVDSADPTNLINQTWWKSYTTIVDAKLAYPNSALCALQVSSRQFQSIPTRGYRVKGLKVQVPSNYNPATRAYTGVWDGTFTVAYTDNPAWCFYDLLLTSRYGLGKYINAANVDKWGLYTIAQYCDAPVPKGDSGPYGSLPGSPSFADFIAISLSGGNLVLDMTSLGQAWDADYGFDVGMECDVLPDFDAISRRGVVTSIAGAVMTLSPRDGCTAFVPIASNPDNVMVTASFISEPRFRCNLLLHTQEDAFRVVSNLASVFRAMNYWASGAVFVAQDAPKDPEYLFTSANVVDGLFSYTGSGRRARHNAVVVSWNDPNNHFAIAKELVADEEGLSAAGAHWNPTETVALGCTSKGQARRLGRWLLYSERLETEVVTFRTGLEGALRNPGAIITIQDQYRAGKRFGGRVVDATTTTVTLDSDFQCEVLKTYKLAVILPTGAIEERDISTSATTFRAVAVSSPFSQAPTKDSVWVITASDLSPIQYRVLSVSEIEPHLYEVTALKFDPTKFAQVEMGLPNQPITTTVIPSSVAPSGLTLTESLYRTAAGIQVMLQAKWNQIPSATGYVVRWRRAGDNWSADREQQSHFFELSDVQPGSFTVQVAASYNGLLTSFTESTYTVLGKTAAPANVTGFAAVLGPVSATLSWTGIADLDWDYYEIREGGSAWGTGDTLVTKERTTRFEYAYPIVSGSKTLRIKAVDTSGNYSATAASLSLTINSKFDGGNLSTGVGQVDAGTVRMLAKGHQTGSKHFGASSNGVTFAVGFQNVPLILLRGGILYEPRAKWGTLGDGTEAGAVLAATPMYEDLVALNPTASGFDLRARLRQKAATTARTADANTVNNSLTAIGNTADATLNNAASGAVADTYTVHFKVVVTAQTLYLGSTPPFYSTTATLTLAIETSDDGGTTWVERATYAYSKTTNSSSPVNTGSAYATEAKTIVVSGLSSNATADKIRIKAKDFQVTGGDPHSDPGGSGSFTAHLFAFTSATPNDPDHALTYNTAADQFASKTPDTEDVIYWEAIEVSG